MAAHRAEQWLRAGPVLVGQAFDVPGQVGHGGHSMTPLLTPTLIWSYIEVAIRAYQTLINLYLRECASSGKRLEMNWKSVA